MAAAGVGALLVLTACSSGADGPSPSAPAASASSGAEASASASPASTPSSTLTAAQQQAFDEAVAVVMAYRQTIVDLYSGSRSDLNALDEVTTGVLLQDNLKNVQQGLAGGRRVTPEGARLSLVGASALAVNLNDDPRRVVVMACIDSSRLTNIEGDGTASVGLREALEYEVVQTAYLPDPGWAVAEVRGAQDPKDRTC
jgi:hypothetical protein